MTPSSRCRYSSNTQGQTSGSVDNRDAQTIDVLPTIVDVFGAFRAAPMTSRSRRFTPRRSTFVDGHPCGGQRHRVGAAADPPRGGPAGDELMTDLLGPYRGAYSIYAASGHMELSSASRSDRLRSPSARARIALEDAERFSSVDLDGYFLPVYLAGNVHRTRCPDRGWRSRSTALSPASTRFTSTTRASRWSSS